MTCRELIDFLMAYLADELPAEQRTLFDEHLAECPDCVNYMKSYLDTLRLEEAAFAQPSEPMPEDLVRAILAAQQKPNA
jgi:predicted anti-sigma-YlaC factor YlaD